MKTSRTEKKSSAVRGSKVVIPRKPNDKGGERDFLFLYIYYVYAIRYILFYTGAILETRNSNSIAPNDIKKSNIRVVLFTTMTRTRPLWR